jgi:LysR family transcriptional regulator, glycine cleavage system transcriptional activator
MSTAVSSESMTLPDIESLRCFVAAAAHKNFRRAASEVGLSPAAFSDRISRLEDLLGVRLFARTTRACVLTPEGEKALVHAKRTLAHARACLEASHEGPLTFDLVIGTRFELGMSWLVPGLARLGAACPERRLHLNFGDTDGLLRALGEAAVDAVVTSARLSHVALEAAALHEELYVLVASPKLLAKSALRSHEDAAHHTLLDAHKDLPLFRYFLDGRPARESWRFAHVERLGTIGAIAVRAREGFGVAVLPRYYVERDLSKGVLVEPFPKARVASDFFRLVWRKDHPRDADLQRLAADLRAMPLK